MDNQNTFPADLVCPEMQKVRDWLTAQRIIWLDRSDWESPRYWVCRTHFAASGVTFSVVNGDGTYGGVDVRGVQHGKLEVWASNQENPIGWLTAQDVIDSIRELLPKE